MSVPVFLALMIKTRKFKFFTLIQLEIDEAKKEESITIAQQSAGETVPVVT